MKRVDLTRSARKVELIDKVCTGFHDDAASAVERSTDAAPIATRELLLPSQPYSAERRAARS